MYLLIIIIFINLWLRFIILVWNFDRVELYIVLAHLISVFNSSDFSCTTQINQFHIFDHTQGLNASNLCITYIILHSVTESFKWLFINSKILSLEHKYTNLDVIDIDQGKVCIYSFPCIFRSLFWSIISFDLFAKSNLSDTAHQSRHASCFDWHNKRTLNVLWKFMYSLFRYLEMKPNFFCTIFVVW